MDSRSTLATSSRNPYTSRHLPFPLDPSLVRKLDSHLIPLITVLYISSFLVRFNIATARLFHLEADLSLGGTQYQLAASIFYLTYCVFAVPSNLVLQRFTPRRWIALLAVLWGLIATLMGLVQSYGGLVACRLLLGAAEAGLWPGLVVYLTFFYTRHELAVRVGYTFVAAAFSGSLGGSLGYAIGLMNGTRGLSGWRWIMIIEGLPGVCLGVFTYFWLPNDFRSAWFLGEKEKEEMAKEQEVEYGSTTSAQVFDRKDMIKALTDWKVWAFCVGQFGSGTMLAGYSTFLPTIINGLGHWTTVQVQLLSIPCYFVGAATYMVVAHISDRTQKRGIFCIICGILSLIGYAVLLSDVSFGVHYFGCFLVAMGLYVMFGIPLAWVPTNNPRYGKRATAIGLVLGIGTASATVPPSIYPAAQGPRYIRGHVITMSLVALSTLVYALLHFWYARENRRRANAPLDEKHSEMTFEQLAELGDESPYFMYTE